MPLAAAQESRPRSLNARLFAGLGTIVLLVDFLSEANPFHYLSFANLAHLAHAIAWAHSGSGRMLLIVGFYGRLYLALVCGALALGYFGATKFARRPPNRTLGLVSFGMIVAGIAVKFVWSPLTKRYPIHESNLGLFLAYAAAYNCFSWGTLLSIATLAWAFLKGAAIRWRTRSRIGAPAQAP
jgi:hypothetical protein